MKPVIDKERKQANTSEMKSGIILFPGLLITYRAFHKFTRPPRKLRSQTKEEHSQAVRSIERYGQVASVRVPRCGKKVKVFVEKRPDEIDWCVEALCLCSKEEYSVKFRENVNSLISEHVKAVLRQGGHIAEHEWFSISICTRIKCFVVTSIFHVFFMTSIFQVWFVHKKYLRWLPAVSWKVGKKSKFQPQKVPMNTSEKNETKDIHRITFRASNSFNGIKCFICCYDNSDVSKWSKINI